MILFAHGAHQIPTFCLMKWNLVNEMWVSYAPVPVVPCVHVSCPSCQWPPCRNELNFNICVTTAHINPLLTLVKWTASPDFAVLFYRLLFCYISY
jgi:hypothetical protein